MTREEAFAEAQEHARRLMGLLYEIRQRHPPSEFPSIWQHIPHAQTMLHKVMEEIAKAKEGAHK